MKITTKTEYFYIINDWNPTYTKFNKQRENNAIQLSEQYIYVVVLQQQQFRINFSYLVRLV